MITDHPLSFDPDEQAWKPFRDATSRWVETGEGGVACATCGAVAPVGDWQFGFDLGAPAFGFWRWPPLDVSFCGEFGNQLGHRTEEQAGTF
ncbi:hypothetical protein [Streptomyces sp. NBC_00344]|uniref:hypothetical protein n=1 Tax=Streptomyces sp. NBC_00344 TaxID=2975720 RepID=UPI002E23BB2D